LVFRPFGFRRKPTCFSKIKLTFYINALCVVLNATLIVSAKKISARVRVRLQAIGHWAILTGIPMWFTS
jgi:hypothetical protein